MRILTVSPDQYERNRSFLKQMHRLRATVFGVRLEWEVSITAEEERDQYDGYKPTYLLAITDSGLVAGCARLLPAAGPTMLERTFPQLLETGSLVAHSGMVESSRFCVDTALASRRMQANCIWPRSPCSPASSNGRWRAATARSSRQPIFVSSAS